MQGGEPAPPAADVVAVPAAGTPKQQLARALLQQGGPGSAKDGSLAGSGRVAATPAGSVKIKQRRFPNGDRYVGGWANGLPEGEGKYEWHDGSCFEGGWKAGHKHGVGKYVWTSGATYQGEWRHGCMHGVGTFEAPDGSKYQGGWCEDLKHGLGRKIYANGDVYEGLWVAGKPDGPGRYIWVDFNEYDGEWRAGRMHGNGTFVWKTGERYDGEWRDGQEEGVGVFTFRDGSTYEGFWRAGRKHGVGLFRPPSSTLTSRRSLAGFGRLDSTRTRSVAGAPGGTPSEGRSAFADATAAAAALPDEAAAEVGHGRGRGAPGGAKAAAAQQLSGLPQQQSAVPEPQLSSIKSQASMALSERGGSVAGKRGLVVVKEYRDGKLVQQHPLSPGDVASIRAALGLGGLERRGSTAGGGASDAGGGGASDAGGGGAPGSGGGAQQGGGAGHHRSARQQVTPLGEVVFKDHSAYDLMVQLQLGIRWSVTSAALDHTISAVAPSALQPPDYATTLSQDFPRAGSRSTPVHPASDFVWKDYAPAAFRTLRELAGVQQHDFIAQLCGDQALRLLASPGKSGAVFFLSADERFLVKTITAPEGKLLLRLLQRYAQHMERYPNSLLTRFYGLHRVSSPPGGLRKKVRFVVMANIFCTGLPIHRRYDLKGSTAGRSAGPAAAQNPDMTTVLKDLDLGQCFRLEAGWAATLTEQLAADTALLASGGVMDYSLLLGVHERERSGAAQQRGQQPQQPAEGQQQAAEEAGLSNFVEHSGHSDLTAALARLEGQLSRMQLEPWVSSALLQLGQANLLSGLTGSGGGRPGHSSGGGGRRAALARSPTLVLATRPKRSPSSCRPLALAPGGTDDLSHSMGLTRVTLGVNMAAMALPLPDAPGSRSRGASPQGEQDVVLYFGIIDVLQGYTLRKRLESGARRLAASAAAISAVAPGYYAERFLRFMARIFT